MKRPENFRASVRRASLNRLIAEHVPSRWPKQARMAEALGFSEAYFSQMKKGVRTIGNESAHKIEQGLGLSMGALDRDEHRIREDAGLPLGKAIPLPGSAESQPFSAWNYSGASIRVTVVGSAQLLDTGFCTSLTTKLTDGYVEHLSRDRDAYALRCVGDAMRPLIKDGDFVVLYPNHAPINGDEVLVVLKDGRMVLRELAYVRDDAMTLLAINSTHGRTTVPLSQIDRCHYVAAVVRRAAWREH